MYHGSEGGAFNEQVATTFQVMKIGSICFIFFSGNHFNKAVVMKMLLKNQKGTFYVAIARV